ncbi:hypothetical protein Scep_015100 [Stephania cephalantha]|uniref:Uncharacterized protein n=1 Tax=Stephania cephalantha TaxID=152367 RepID=A0AAP0J2J6_9MAGN
MDSRGRYPIWSALRGYESPLPTDPPVDFDEKDYPDYGSLFLMVMMVMMRFTRTLRLHHLPRRVIATIRRRSPKQQQ